MTFRHGAIVLLACTLAPVPASAAGPSPRAVYARALEREGVVRSSAPATPVQIRGVIAAYEAMVRRYPASGYSDNALWQAANLALMASQQFAQDADRRAAVRLLTQLKNQYPASSLVPRAKELLRGLEAPPAPAPADPPATDPTDAPQQPQAAASAPAMIRDIRRTPIPDGMRVTIEMDSETSFRAERLENPRRVFFVWKGTRAGPALLAATLKLNEAVVGEIRLGRHPK